MDAPQQEELRHVRPVLAPPMMSAYKTPLEFLRARIEFRRATEPNFSVTKQCAKLRRCSKALVSMILSGQRPITPERAEDLSLLMGLSTKERHAFRHWVDPQNEPAPENSVNNGQPRSLNQLRSHRRKEVSQDLLKDWLNVYVKDAFRFEAIQKHPELLSRLLCTIARPERIQKSVKFLLREGYLRRTVDGRTVEDTPLMIAEVPDKSKKIRLFHRQSLIIARDALETFSVEKRLANAVVLALSRTKYLELLELIEEFAEKLKNFAEQDTTTEEASVQNANAEGSKQKPTSSLYQLIVHLSPVGGALGEV